ncbi:MULTISPECIES: hypothetical protein [unclassified Coleofasciculus]|nr:MULTISPECIES: hypothetical protein [unclassified Coleofasciculus]
MLNGSIKTPDPAFVYSLGGKPKARNLKVSGAERLFIESDR